MKEKYGVFKMKYENIYANTGSHCQLGLLLMTTEFEHDAIEYLNYLSEMKTDDEFYIIMKVYHNTK